MRVVRIVLGIVAGYLAIGLLLGGYLVLRHGWRALSDHRFYVTLLSCVAALIAIGAALVGLAFVRRIVERVLGGAVVSEDRRRHRYRPVILDGED